MFNFIRKCFDTRTELQKLAHDRNLTLIGCDSNWMVMDANGCILSTSTTATAALSNAIFSGN